MTTTRSPAPAVEATPPPPAPRRTSVVGVLPVLVVLGGVGLVMAGAAVSAPETFSLTLLLVGVAVAGALLGLVDPVVAGCYLLVAGFFRLATPDGLLPVEPFMLAFFGLLLSVGLHVRKHGRPVARLGLLGVFVGLYVAWNVISMLLPHEYPATYPLSGLTTSVWRFVLVGAAMPFLALVVGILAFGRVRAMRMLLLTLMGVAAYSAFVSIMQFYGPSALVWPRYIIDAPGWDNRAVGVANQPVVNGLVLVLGYLASVMVASHRPFRPVVRWSAGLLAPACCVGVYLTHTRVAYLCFAVVVVLGIVLARRWRTGFVITLVTMVVGVAMNWSTFSSDDRSEGGVGSAGEIQDRLNMITTSLWAIGQKPFTGWGIGRFPPVNTYHHLQWSPSTPWERGYGIASHFDLLGIAVELGLLGALLWLLAMGTAFGRLLTAARDLPDEGLFDQKFALFALLALASLVVTGVTVDLRFFDFPNIMVMLLVGAAIGRAARVRRSISEGRG